MKRKYSGLDAVKVAFSEGEGFFTTSLSKCIRVVANTESEYVCIDPNSAQVIINFTRENPAFEYCD